MFICVSYTFFVFLVHTAGPICLSTSSERTFWAYKVVTEASLTANVQDRVYCANTHLDNMNTFWLMNAICWNGMHWILDFLMPLLVTGLIGITDTDETKQIENRVLWVFESSYIQRVCVCLMVLLFLNVFVCGRTVQRILLWIHPQLILMMRTFSWLNQWEISAEMSV